MPRNRPSLRFHFSTGPLSFVFRLDVAVFVVIATQLAAHMPVGRDTKSGGNQGIPAVRDRRQIRRVKPQWPGMKTN